MGKRRKTGSAADVRSEQYAKLCDFFWRLDYPDTPKGMLHTSDVCRARATAVLKILGLNKQFEEDAMEHLKKLSPEQLKSFIRYAEGRE